jgi:hypothetical protein
MDSGIAAHLGLSAMGLGSPIPSWLDGLVWAAFIADPAQAMAANILYGLIYSRHQARKTAQVAPGHRIW